jgi:hypothetical protein
MRRAIVCVALSVSFYATTPVVAWNGVGHMTVAKIAFDGLSAKEREEAFDLLKHHPHYQAYLLKNKPPGVAEEEWVFLRAATWPDWVRGPLPPERPDPSIIRYHRPGDHFANVPVFAPDVTLVFAEKVRKRASPHDVVCGLKQRQAELRLKTASMEDKAIALCWILHLVGDIHQPLHCATLYSECLFPDGDAGGNAVGIRIGGQKVRLHTYWDGLLGAASNELGEIRDDSDYAEEAYKLVSLRSAKVINDFARPSLNELKQHEQFADWGAESLSLAREVAYADGAIARIAVKVPPGFDAEVPEDAMEAPEGYAAKASRVADRRAALAGYRLVDTLRSTLPRK